jgi:hypothetical protein
MKIFVQSAIILLIVAASCLAFTLPVIADDYELQEVMTGNAPGLYAQVNGSGETYFGDSLRVTFTNNTGESYKVKVPIGLRLIPANSFVQTMYTAGGESLSVPPGSSSYIIKGFCGEQYDSAPGSSDTFTPGGFAEGDLMQTLQEINRQKAFDHDGQDAVWHYTNDNDISSNDTAQELAGGGNSVSPGEAAAAGGAAAGTVVIGVIFNNLLNGGGGTGTSTRTGTEGGGPDDDMIFKPDDEFVGPPGDGFEETPPPPEDDISYDESRTDLRPPTGDAVNLRTLPQDGVPPEIQPPIDIADIPPPEDPGDGIMIAGGGPQMIWDALLRRGGGPTEIPKNLPPNMKIPKDEGFFEFLKRKLWDETPGRYDTPEERAAKDAANRAAGKRFRENTPWGSASKKDKALSDPVRFSQTGEGNPRTFVLQIKREYYEKNASEGLRWTRRLLNLKSLTNQKTIRPNWKGPPSAYDLKKVLGPHQVVRDYSGVTDLVRDFIEPDVKTFQTDLIPNYKYDLDGHKAMDTWIENHEGNMPDHNDPEEVEAFMKLYRKVKGE